MRVGPSLAKPSPEIRVEDLPATCSTRKATLIMGDEAQKALNLTPRTPNFVSKPWTFHPRPPGQSLGLIKREPDAQTDTPQPPERKVSQFASKFKIPSPQVKLEKKAEIAKAPKQPEKEQAGTSRHPVSVLCPQFDLFRFVCKR